MECVICHACHPVHKHVEILVTNQSRTVTVLSVSRGVDVLKAIYNTVRYKSLLLDVLLLTYLHRSGTPLYTEI